MFSKGDWVTTKDIDTIPFKLEDDVSEYVVYMEAKYGGARSKTILVVTHPRTKEQIPVDAVRLATEQDFIKSHQRMLEKRDAVEKSIQSVSDLHGQFLKDTRNLHIID